MKSVMNHNFSKIPGPQLERSTFDRSFAHKTTFNGGDLIPFYHMEILPGDTVSSQSTVLARLQSLIFPVMDNIFFDLFFFFVPNRLLWDHWEEFITGNDATPGSQTTYIIPTIHGAEDEFPVDPGTLADYFGLPLVGNIVGGVNALPFRAYNLIWNEWFRDENLQEKVQFDTDDGPDDPDLYRDILRRGKRKDYFTSCFLTSQKGAAITLPLGTSAPVIGDGFAVKFWDGTNNQFLNYNNNTGFNGILGVSQNSGVPGGTPDGTVPSDDKYLGLNPDPAQSSHMFADLSNATSATINQLRQAFAFQQILELDERGGSRYTEHLQATWGQRPEDYRLQRPEYLGGSSKPFMVNQVQQTSGTPTTVSLDPGETPQGNLAAYGYHSSQAGFTKSFVEHGYIIGLVNVRADITYQQGLDRSWTRSTRFDYPHPALMHLGEQAVMQKEIYCVGNNPTADNTVFGYQERWAEYRYKYSYVSNMFRSAMAASLDAWHLALNFTSSPTLGATFIQDDPPLDRVIAVQNEPQIIMDSFTSIRHTRLMPTYSVPGLMGRF